MRIREFQRFSLVLCIKNRKPRTNKNNGNWKMEEMEEGGV